MLINSNNFLSIAKFTGIVAMMILAILFGGLVLIVGLVAAISDKKLTGFIAILQILSGDYIKGARPCNVNKFLSK